MNQKKLDKATQLLRAIDNKTNRMIIHFLAVHGPMTNTELWIKMRMDKLDEVTRRLITLREVGIVDSHQLGKNTYNSINKVAFDRVASAIEDFSNPQVYMSYAI